MYKPTYKLTIKGAEKVTAFISDCKKQRDELLRSGKDTAENTDLPSVSDIESDLNSFLVEQGDYFNKWGITDNHYSRPLILKIGEDFADRELKTRTSSRDAIFTSVWNGGTEISSHCKVDTETGNIFDIEAVNVTGMNLETLDEEYVVLDNKKYGVSKDDRPKIIERTPKYELTDETRKVISGNRTVTLSRIRALKDFGVVKAGELGGFIEKEKNLSHAGRAWVCMDALVYDEAIVHGNALISGNAEVFEHADVNENACVVNNAHVYGHAKIYGDATVYENAEVFGDAEVYGQAEVLKDAKVCGDAKVYGWSEIKGIACDKAVIYNECVLQDQKYTTEGLSSRNESPKKQEIER
jgi:hypothetical protein